MLDNNKRIISRILDTITSTEGDEALHMNMLATNLDKESLKYLDLKTWPGDREEYAEITRLGDFMEQSCIGNDPGIYTWEATDSSDSVADFLIGLKTAVRNNASRDLLGDAAVDTLELPLEYREFLKHAPGVIYPNLDRQMFSYTSVLPD